ncbi:MAG: AfsR/SARP family transcriptional regulator [Propionibacteriaceae bacterium]|nr:AfsR/SARP family transcriptional regulator [Propionibacteriaceae bacterium]
MTANAGFEDPAVRLLLLGRATVMRGEREIRLGKRQRAVLGVLGAHLGEAVSTDRLIDRVWNGQPPATAASALRVHVSKIRAAVALDGQTPLQHETAGYRLRGAGITTDVAELQELVGRIDLGDPEAADQLLKQALALFRGPPLVDLEDHESRVLAQALIEVRDRLSEDRVKVLLDLGREQAAAEMAADLVGAAPLRERRTRQLMLALYRSGRQADALAAGARLRDLLRDEFGVDPDPDTTRLEVAILRQDQSLLRHLGGGRGPDLDRAPRRPAPVHHQMSPPIRHLVTDRLTGATAAERLLVGLIAILGEFTDPRVLAAAADLTAAEAEQTVAALIQRRLVAPLAPPAPVSLYRPEFGTAWLEQRSPIERAMLHRRAADALERVLNPVAGSLTAIAWHRLASLNAAPAEPATRAQALGTVTQAAASCLSAGFAESAQELCAEALTLDVPDATRLDLTRLLIEALTARGAIEHAEREWRSALALARTVDDPERFALLALTRTWVSRSVTVRSDLPEVLAEAQERLGPASTPLSIRVRAAAMLELSVPGRVPPTREAVQSLQDAAAQVGDRESMRYALLTHHALNRASPDVAGREGIAEELLRESQGLPRWECWALSEVIFDCFILGRFTEVPALIDQLKDAANAANSERSLWLAQLSKASLHRDLGRFAEADRVAEAALLRGVTAGLPDAIAAEAGHRLAAHLVRDSLEGFRPAMERLWVVAPANTLLPAAIALALAQAGRADAAVDPLRTALDDVLDAPTTAFTPFTLALAAETLWAGAPPWPGLIGALQRRAAPYRGQFIAVGLVATSLGPVDRILGMLAALAGDRDQAGADLAAAQRQCAEAGTPVWEIRSAADRVQVADETTARELAKHYLPLARELGMQPSAKAFEAVVS